MFEIGSPSGKASPATKSTVDKKPLPLDGVNDHNAGIASTDHSTPRQEYQTYSVPTKSLGYGVQLRSTVGPTNIQLDGQSELTRNHGVRSLRAAVGAEVATPDNRRYGTDIVNERLLDRYLECSAINDVLRNKTERLDEELRVALHFAESFWPNGDTAKNVLLRKMRHMLHILQSN